MPPKRFKNVTVEDYVYDYFYNDWLQHKEEFKLKKGINSFAGFITYRLTQLMEQEKKHTG